MAKYYFILFLSVLLFVSCKQSNKLDDMNRVGFSGENILDKAYITRDKNTKDAYLHIDIDGDWFLYSGTTVDDIDMSDPVLKGNKAGVFRINVSDSVRSYFELITDKGKAILAENHLPMAGGYNYRDLGGIRNAEGKYIKWGKILRSDDLHNLTDSDLKYLSSIPLISIVDFRTEDEIKTAADKNPSTVIDNYKLSISPGNLMTAKDMTSMSPEEINNFMFDMNEILVTDSSIISQYKSFFELLQNESDTPLMFHCSAGKDRTGMGAALILFSLGVDEETIMNDYLLSNVYLADKYSEYITKYPHLKPLFEVQSQYLQSGIDKIKKEHGSVENYLINILNVNIDKMKALYLY